MGWRRGVTWLNGMDGVDLIGIGSDRIGSDEVVMGVRWNEIGKGCIGQGGEGKEYAWNCASAACCMLHAA